MKNTPHRPTKLAGEQTGGWASSPRRKVENWGMSYHCSKCGMTRVLIQSKAERIFHTCRARDGSTWLECSMTLVYGVAK